MGTTVSEIKAMLQVADADELAALERSLVADTRKGVVQALQVARRRIQAEAAENARLEGMFAYQEELAATRGGGVIVGLDEVGRGSLAGPLAVGAVVLPPDVRIVGLNDSKQVTPAERRRIAEEVRACALACAVVYIQPAEIDTRGIGKCLVSAFQKAIREIEALGVVPDVVLLDGVALHMDPREINVVKGDGKCASIAAASIVAKVARDDLMCELAKEYPAYGWDGCKGYGSAAHIEAIKTYGLTPYHRVSFCSNLMQETLF